MACMIAALIAATLGWAQAIPSPPDQAPRYVRLTGTALREALVGKYVQPRSCLSGSGDPCGGIFSGSRNRYHLAGDRSPWITGSYILEEDQVCISMPRRATECLFLTRSNRGAFFLISTANAALPPFEVQITDATGRTPDF